MLPHEGFFCMYFLCLQQWFLIGVSFRFWISYIRRIDNTSKILYQYGGPFIYFSVATCIIECHWFIQWTSDMFVESTLTVKLWIPIRKKQKSKEQISNISCASKNHRWNIIFWYSKYCFEFWNKANMFACEHIF